MKERSAQYIFQKAKKRGYDPLENPRILQHHVEDGNRSGRPKEITEEIEQNLVDLVTADRAGREKSSEVLAYETGISSSSALNVLHKHGFSAVKRTTKPGLDERQRQLRYEFCLAHKDWTLEDWKNVI